jgi:hypothetical protein
MEATLRPFSCTTMLNTLVEFCDPGLRFRSCLDVITNIFNQFEPYGGAKHDIEYIFLFPLKNGSDKC